MIFSRILAVIVAVGITFPTFASAAEPVPDLSGGGWSGQWISDKNGHHGPLRATFRKVSDSSYRVTFTGRFWKLIPFIYSVNLNATPTDSGVILLTGSTALGPVMGTFRYDGHATATHFEARFTSKNDCGKFVLDRCGCGN